MTLRWMWLAAGTVATALAAASPARAIAAVASAARPSSGPQEQGAQRADAWIAVEAAAISLSGVPAAPLLAWVRAEPRRAPPLLDEDVLASIPAARGASMALAQLDAAHMLSRCTLPSPFDGGGVLALGDHALLAALVDGAGGEGARAMVGVVRAGQLAALLARCEKPTLAVLEAQRVIVARARAVAWYLAEQRQMDAVQLARVVRILAPALSSTAFERAVAGERLRLGRSLSLAEQDRVAVLDAALARDLEDQHALELAAASYESIARPVHRVVIACGTSPTAPRHFTMARDAVAVLERRGEQALAGDSVVMPSFEGRQGFVFVRTGPVARSCGFQDGDVVLAVNGIGLRMLDDSLARMVRALRRERHAIFSVRRGGSLTTWRIDVARPAPVTP